MKKHTSFKIGGPTDYMILPKSYEEVMESMVFIENMNLPYMIIGKGSNLLISDKGIRGVVIKLGDNFAKIKREGNIISAQGGASLEDIANFTIKESLAGFEFAAGIPGSVGGAMVMNAGAYGGEMKDIAHSVTVLENGEIKEILAEDLDLVYRGSNIIEKKRIVLEAKFKLQEGNSQTIQEKIYELSEERALKQPLEYPSAGSTFKRPKGYFAGKLIDDSGLRGFRYKDAQVSEKHCGFIVNRGNAKCQDVMYLIEAVQKVVYEKFGVLLERELKIVGDIE